MKARLGVGDAAVVDSSKGRLVPCDQPSDPGIQMKSLVLKERLRSILQPASGRSSERGAALLETVMSVGFLVVIAIGMSKLLRPVVTEAFEKIALALSSVGP